MRFKVEGSPRTPRHRWLCRPISLHVVIEPLYVGGKPSYVVVKPMYHLYRVGGIGVTAGSWVGVGGWGLGIGVYGSLAPPSGLGFSFVFWSVVFGPGICGVGVGFWVRNFGVYVLEVSAFGG